MRTRTFAPLSAILALGIVVAAGSAAYALGGPSGSGGRGYHPPLHGPGSSHNPIIKRAPVHGPGSSHNPIVKRSLHGPGSSHNPIVIRRRGRY
jgi:hypothetical protein